MSRLWLFGGMILSLALVGITSGGTAAAAEIVKASNADALNLEAAWEGGLVPTASDVAVWNSTVTATNAAGSPTINQLGGDAPWQGISITDVGGTANQSGTTAGIQILNSGSANTLTLGDGGINMSAATQALLTQAKITLAASQVWDITNANTSGNPFGNAGINAGLSEDLMLNAQSLGAAFDLGGNTLTLQGNGSVGVTSGYTISNGTLLVNNTGAGGTWIQSGGSRATTLTSDVTVSVGSGSNLRLRANSGSGGVGIDSQATISIATGGKLQLENNNGGNSLTQAAPLSFAAGTTLDLLLNNNGGLTVAAETATAGPIAWNVSGNGNNANGAAFTGNLTGNGVITYVNAATNTNGQVRLSGDNSGFTGSFSLAGTSGNRSLRLAAPTAGSSSATWSVAGGSTLEVDGHTVELGTLNGAGSVVNTSFNPAVVNVGGGSFSGVLADGFGGGTLALTKLGSGTLSLAGASTYTGLTTVTAGTLSVTTAQSGGGGIVVEDAGTFLVTQPDGFSTLNASSITLGSAGGATLGVVPGDSQSVAPITVTALDVNGPSTLSVQGAPVTGDLLVSYGAIGGTSGVAGLALALPFRVSGTLVNDTVASVLKLGNVVANTPRWNGTINNVWNIDSTGTGGAGTANWITSASQQSTTYVQAGPSQTDSVIFNDSAAGSTAIDLVDDVTPVSITIDNSTKNYAFSGSGSIGGTTGIIKSGTGSLTLATANTFSGGVQIDGGALNIGNAGGLGTGTLTLAAGTTLDNTSGAGIVATAAVPQVWNGDLTFVGSSDLDLGQGAVSLVSSPTVTVSAGTLAVGGLGGTGLGLTKAGPGTLAIGASSYDGPTTILGGTLRARAAGAFNSSIGVTLSNAAGVALDLNGFNLTANTIDGGGAAGGDVYLGGGVLTTASAGTIGGLSGAGGIVKNDGLTTFTIAGDTSGFAGTTTINGGVLDVGNASDYFASPGTRTLTMQNRSVLQGNGTITGTVGSGNEIVSGSGGFAARGGDLTLDFGGDGTGTGPTIKFNSGGQVFGGGLVLGSATADAKVTLLNSISINNHQGSRAVVVPQGQAGAVAEMAGAIIQEYPTAKSSLLKQGDGTLILSAANTYSGDTIVEAGVVKITNPLALQNSALPLDNVGSFDFTGVTEPTVGGLKGSSDLATKIAGFDGVTTLTLNTFNTVPLTPDTYFGAISDGAGGMNLVKTGPGTQSLEGTLAYTGNTTVTGGTLQLGFSSSIAASTVVTVGAGATLDLAAQSEPLSATGAKQVAGGGTLAGSLSVGGGGTLSPGDDVGTFTTTQGVTWASGGNLNWQISDATGTAGTAPGWDLLSVGGSLDITATSAAPFTLNLWSLSSTGPAVDGPAANFSGSSDYTWTFASAAGGITGFSADAFQVVTGPANGTSGFANPFADGSFSVAQAGNDLNLVFTKGTMPLDIIIDVPTGVQTQAEAGYPSIAEANSVTKIGAGTVVFDAANGYAGPTVIQAGTLEVSNDAALTGSAVTVDPLGTLAIASGTTLRTPAVTLAGGTLSAGTLLINGSTGITSLAINSGALLGSLATEVGAGGTMTLPQNARVRVGVGSLSVVETSGGGLLDVGAGQVSVAAGGITAAALRADVIAGRNGGGWNGTAGITSSAAAASGGTRAVGYVVGVDGAARVSFAAPGDIDLGGTVDVFDLVGINSSGRYGTGTASVWATGDFNYDGVTNVFDLVSINTAGAYGRGNYFPAGPATASGLGSVAAVPEPGAAVLAAMGLAGLAAMAGRRRRV
jgi:fibronectin-binding autotransporter adhesin